MSMITSPATTKLDLSPDEPVLCIGSMDLGSGLDATTGKLMGTPFTEFAILPPSGHSGKESFFFMAHLDVDRLQTMSPNYTIFPESLTFPRDLALLGTKARKDTVETSLLDASKNGAPPCTIFLVIDWSRDDVASIASEPELNKEAARVYTQGPEQFRAKYGDYFVSQVFYQTRYTIIWACTADDPSDMANFQAKLSLHIMSDRFGHNLRTAALDHKVTLHLLSCTYVGIPPAKRSTPFFRNRSKDHEDLDPVAAMRQFQVEAEPAPYSATLRHYRTLPQIGDNGPPLSISLSEELYRDICQAVSEVQSALFLADVVPANADVRQVQRSRIGSLVQDIYTKRLTCAQDPEPLKTALQNLRHLRRDMSRRLERYQLVLRARNVSFETLKQKFMVSTEDSDGVWVKGTSIYRLGIVNFNPPQVEAYAMRKELVSEVVAPEQDLYALPTEYTLSFPGKAETLGYLVGLIVEDCSAEQSGSGSVYIQRDIVFGTKNSVNIKVKGSHRKGMHWKMHAYYILEKDIELSTDESPLPDVGESRRNSTSTSPWHALRKAFRNEL